MPLAALGPALRNLWSISGTSLYSLQELPPHKASKKTVNTEALHRKKTLFLVQKPVKHTQLELLPCLSKPGGAGGQTQEGLGDLAPPKRSPAPSQQDSWAQGSDTPKGWFARRSPLQSGTTLPAAL